MMGKTSVWGPVESTGLCRPVVWIRHLRVLFHLAAWLMTQLYELAVLGSIIKGVVCSDSSTFCVYSLCGVCSFTVTVWRRLGWGLVQVNLVNSMFSWASILGSIPQWLFYEVKTFVQCLVCRVSITRANHSLIQHSPDNETCKPTCSWQFFLA